jgi:RND superfamily putative drug exporter
MLDRLALLLHRRAGRVLAIAGLFVALAGVLGGPVVGLLDNDDDFDDPASESVLASDRVREATGAGSSPGFVALVRDRDRTGDVRAAIEADPAIARVAGPVVSGDGQAAYLAATFKAGEASGDAALRLAERVEAIPGAVAGGGELAGEQVGTQVSEDLARAELLAFPLLLVLSLWVFRSLVAALLPLLVGMCTILATFLAMRVIDASVTGLSVFSINLVTGVGLGLAIDYSLFVVSRFREELASNGEDVQAALRRTLATAGRTVIFSAATVAAALAALMIFPQRFLYSMGVGGALTALFAAVMSLTVLPALLALLGRRVNAGAPKRLKRSLEREAGTEHAGAWYRLSQFVMRRPGRVAALATALLIAAGLPFLGIQFTGVDAGLLPETASARVVDDALKTEFDADRTSPAYVLADGTREEVTSYAQRLRAIDGVTVADPEPLGEDGFRIEVLAEGRPLGEGAKDAIGAVRSAPAPFDTQVGGQTAGFLDQQESLSSHLPVALAILALTTFAILFLMTGSVILPLKALLMNLLTITAALGILVLIFQEGNLEGLLGFSATGALDSTQPILLAATAFGLSTDYGVFLLTRIKEARDAGAGERESVALGLERTGRIVTAAALLFTVAIGAFATSEMVFIKQLGVGTALAVLIDATIVRALLVPALMRMLGRWNWWAPRPLQRLHRRIGIAEA